MPPAHRPADGSLWATDLQPQLAVNFVGIMYLHLFPAGCAMPLFALAFGNYTDGFTAVDAMPEARKAAIKFVYLSVAVFVAFYLQAACWIRTGSRQASSMRMAYLKSVMRQDVAYFENQMSTGGIWFWT